MRIPSGNTTSHIYFIAVDSTDLKTRETGLSSFTVYRERNNGTATAMTTPTITECDATNMPGVYTLLCDEDMTIGAGNDSEEMVFHITQASMAPVTRTIEIYRRTATSGNTLDVTATGAAGIDWGNVENPATAVDLSGTDIQLCDTVTTSTDIPVLIAAAQADLDILTGSDGVTLATAQPNYAPAKAGDSMDVSSISGDSTAADNLESMYDGTGYTDDEAPATQSQVSGIGSGSGSALNYPVSADNTAGAIIDSVTFVGTQTGTYDNTENDLTTAHQIDHATNAFDIVYRVDCGDVRTAVSVTVDALLNGSNDTANIQVYDHVGSSWDTVETVNGINGSAIEEYSINLFEKHTGALGTSEAGNVYVRFVCTGQSSPTLYVYRLSVAAVPATSTMGYEGGQVWIDETGGTSTGTTLGIDGTFANQSDDFDNGQTIADSLGTSFLHTHPGNSITLTAALQGYNVSNVQCTLNGGSQNADSTRVTGGFIAGTWTRVGTGIMTFSSCSMTNTTSDRCAMLNGCGIVGTFTLTEAGLYPIIDCHAGGPTGIATIDFASLGGATVGMEKWSGDLTVNNMASGDTITIHAVSGGDIILNGADATVIITGVVGSVTNNLTGSPTVTDRSVSSDKVDDIPTTAEFELRTPTAAQLAYIVANAATGMPVTFTTSGGSTTAAVLNNVDGAAASATDDQYNGRLLVFTDGTLKGCVTDITDYVGSTTTATITAIPFAPESTHNARLL